MRENWRRSQVGTYPNLLRNFSPCPEAAPCQVTPIECGGQFHQLPKTCQNQPIVEQDLREAATVLRQFNSNWIAGDLMCRMQLLNVLVESIWMTRGMIKSSSCNRVLLTWLVTPKMWKSMQRVILRPGSFLSDSPLVGCSQFLRPPSTRTRSPVLSRIVASPQPTTAGIPNSRATIAA